MILFTKIHVSTSSVPVPPLGHISRYVYACKFWAVCPILKNEVPLDSFDQAEFNAMNHCNALLDCWILDFLPYWTFWKRFFKFSGHNFVFTKFGTMFIPSLVIRCFFLFLKVLICHSQSKIGSKVAKDEVSSYFSKNWYIDSVQCTKPPNRKWGHISAKLWCVDTKLVCEKTTF